MKESQTRKIWSNLNKLVKSEGKATSNKKIQNPGRKLHLFGKIIIKNKIVLMNFNTLN